MTLLFMHSERIVAELLAQKAELERARPSQLEARQTELAEIRLAIERIRARCFGICERCRQIIPRPELEPNPCARLCRRCARVA